MQKCFSFQTPLVDAGLATPSGMSSVAGGHGLETPELIELRKRKIEADMEGGETPSLFTILPERHADRIGGAMMGSAHTYDIPPPPPLPAVGRGGPGRPPLPPGPGGVDLGGVELALNPEEVDLMDTDAMQAKAEAALRESQVGSVWLRQLERHISESGSYIDGKFRTCRLNACNGLL
jgi:splicing factor 3B subunit 2